MTKIKGKRLIFYSECTGHIMFCHFLKKVYSYVKKKLKTVVTVKLSLKKVYSYVLLYLCCRPKRRRLCWGAPFKE